MSEETKNIDENAPQLISFSEFLEGTPPTQERDISKLCGWVRKSSVPKVGQNTNEFSVLTPDIQLHCSNDICGGTRTFRYSYGDRAMTKIFDEGYFKRTFLVYTCANCRRNQKSFALELNCPSDQEDANGTAYKFGESPLFGPMTPTRLLKLFGDDREVFLKGRRCENQGLGVGAFAYYRRVVESHRDRILEEIIRVSERLRAPAEAIAALRAAKAETQFSKSIDMARDAIPQSLLIGGHNPMTLLHTALSRGLHAESDEECLKLAQSIRLVLADLAERMSQALRDEAELNAAVGRLLRPREKQTGNEIATANPTNAGHVAQMPPK